MNTLANKMIDDWVSCQQKKAMPIPRTDLLPEQPYIGPTIIEMIVELQDAVGKEQYRLLLDAKRRPDGKTIVKSARQCVEELYSELENLRCQK
jgi:hypothetical protein